MWLGLTAKTTNRALVGAVTRVMILPWLGYYLVWLIFMNRNTHFSDKLFWWSTICRGKTEPVAHFVVGADKEK